MDLLGRGIDIRSVYTPEALAAARPFRAHHPPRRARRAGPVPARPAVQAAHHGPPRRAARADRGRYDRIAVVHQSGLLDAILELFDSYWSGRSPSSRRLRRPPTSRARTTSCC